MTTPPPNPAALVQAAQQQTMVNRYLFLKQVALGKLLQQAKQV
jgi:hypothetical protein